MDRRQLEYFLAVAECGSISAAARRLGVSQPTVSESVARMEAENGLPLLRRTGRGVVLTDAGREIVGPAAQVMRGFSAVVEALRPVQELERGSLQIVCPRTLAHDPVASLVGRFRRLHPGLVVTISRPHETETAGDVVASGRAEVALGVTDGTASGLVSERLLRQRVVALVHSAMGVSQAPDLAELVGRGLITTARGGVTRRLLEERIGAQAVHDAIVVETSSTGAMIPLVRAGLGVAFVTEAMSRDAESLGIETRVPHPPLVRDVWLTHARSMSTAAREFAALAREMRDLGEPDA